jgi:hypothetical protein
MKMDLTRVHKKIGEAYFFLHHMAHQEGQEIRDNNLPSVYYDDYLSAFLNAARTIDYRLRHEQKAVYPSWRKAWDTRLTSEDYRLIEFMGFDRNKEVHDSGSGRSETLENIALIPGMTYWDHDVGMVTIGGRADMPPQLIRKQTYNFTIDGAEQKATEACAAYLALLKRMVAEFEADHA